MQGQIADRAEPAQALQRGDRVMSVEQPGAWVHATFTLTKRVEDFGALGITVVLAQ
ncbi:hypothetical protein [Pseudomonas bohemica]|uniref:hypothetical protein n=1 Tax=Pseudomonas bohemica TaxID=2044872 RepID=UPI0018FE4829|nr:hypothetical protein [Pseudomonas bohemica]